MSSAKLAPSVALGGIFETSHKNPWAGANIAYLPYCSSDAWIGDIGASNVRAPRTVLRDARATPARTVRR